MSTKRRKTWVYNPPKTPKPKVPEEIKLFLQKKGEALLETTFKSEYLKPIPEPLEFNHLIDFYTKWHRNYFYFCSEYQCPPESISPHFETKFARIEYLEENEFEVSYMRHTGQWWALRKGTMEDSLKYVSTMVPY